MKKIFALLVCVLMFATMSFTTVFAATDTSEASNESDAVPANITMDDAVPTSITTDDGVTYDFIETSDGIYEAFIPMEIGLEEGSTPGISPRLGIGAGIGYKYVASVKNLHIWCVVNYPVIKSARADFKLTGTYNRSFSDSEYYTAPLNSISLGSILYNIVSGSGYVSCSGTFSTPAANGYFSGGGNIAWGANGGGRSL